MSNKANETSDEDEREATMPDADEAEQYTILSPQPRSQPMALLYTETSDEDSYPLADVTALDEVTAETNAEEVLDDIAAYTDDPEVLEDFRERQEMAIDEEGLMRRLRDHHAETPRLSGGDLDAAWDQGEDAGDETATAEPTPDKDIVEAIGEAVGVTYADDEPLDFARKVYARDEDRWELDPASAEDEEGEEAA